MIDNTLTSDNPSPVRKNILERTQKLIMAIDDDKIRYKRLQYNINPEAAKL